MWLHFQATEWAIIDNVNSHIEKKKIHSFKVIVTKYDYVSISSKLKS